MDNVQSAARERPPAADVERMERALGWRPAVFRSATPERGTSDTAARWIIGEGEGPGSRGRSAFVKIGATALTAEWTRIEYRNYCALEGPYLPRLLGFDDDGDRPALAIEDLSDATWPPPWTDDRVAAVLEALAEIRSTPPPPHLARWSPVGASHWQDVADDPAPFLRLGLCSATWLDEALPVLTAAAAAAPLTGGALIHMDIRSDNVCLRDGRALVVDWPHARLANAEVDVAFWLPHLHAEGGPMPEAILSDAAALAAWVAGFFCAHAGGPPLPEAPHVRPLQRMQARTALAWAARALNLRQPG